MASTLGGAHRACSTRTNISTHARRRPAPGLAGVFALLTLVVASAALAQTSDGGPGPEEQSVQVCVDTPALIFGNAASPTSATVTMAAILPNEPVVVSYAWVQVELTESYAPREPQALPQWRLVGWDEWTDFSSDNTFACTPEDEGDCPQGIRSRLTGDRYRPPPTDLSTIQVELADDAGTFNGVRVRNVCVRLGYYLGSEAPSSPDAGPPVEMPDFEAPDEMPATDAGTAIQVDGSLNAPPLDQGEGDDNAPAASADAESGCTTTDKGAALPLWGLALLGLVGIRRRWCKLRHL